LKLAQVGREANTIANAATKVVRWHNTGAGQKQTRASLADPSGA